MDPGARQTRTTDEATTAHERASLALSAARMGEFEWDADRDRLFISERMAAITGLPAGERQPDTARFVAHVHPDDAARVSEAIRTALGGVERLGLEFRFTRPADGRCTRSPPTCRTRSASTGWSA